MMRRGGNSLPKRTPRSPGGKDSGVIRDFEPRDQDAVRALVLDGMRERWGEAYDPSANADLEDIASTYVARGAEVVVLELDGVVAGCGTLIHETETRARMVRVSVHGDHRRRGLGRQIVNHLVDRARARGFTEVVVTTDTPWTSAVDLYRACGFTEAHRDESDTHFLKRYLDRGLPR